MNFLLTHTPLLYFIQSFWRDEAYSVMLAKLPILEIIRKSSFEPPLYYLLLHFWIKLFGTSEIATRSLSLLGVVLATIVIIEWAPKLFSSKFFQWMLPISFILNPMILYYAFEVRAYGWYIFFATLTLFAYFQKRWMLFCVATIAGIYTHLYMGIVPAIFAVHYAVTQRIWKKKWSWKQGIKNPMVKTMVLIAIFSLPLLVRFFSMAQKFKDSWYYPVDFHLIKSVLGNMFLGYEGTPWFFWNTTAYVSAVLLLFFIGSLIPKATRKTTGLLFSLIFIPLITVIGISFIKPLFVNRYVIPVTIAEILLLNHALSLIKPKILGKTLAIVMLGGIIIFNIWYPPQHPKLDIRTPLQIIGMLKTPSDFIYADDPIIFFETLYYAKDEHFVRLYNPKGVAFPWYIGESVVDPQLITSRLPEYPKKAYLISRDGTYSIAFTKSFLSP